MAEEFEDKLKKAKQILQDLNENELSLNESLKAYKQGVKALKEATKMLQNAKLVYEEQRQA